MELSIKDIAPVALFVYNRLEHTKNTIDALKNNYNSENTILYIFSDGVKKESDEEKVKNLRMYLKSIVGFKKVELIERETNYGLSKSIISGVTQLIEKYGKLIVLEDDIITSSNFLNLMNYALKLYENENKVISITGYTYPIKKLPQSFFLKGADCWSWATWKRGWDLFEADGKILLDEIISKNLSKEFNFNDSYEYTNMLESQILGKNDSWAIRWYASAFLKNKLTLYFGKSLIKNIGLDSTGINCGNDVRFITELNEEEFVLEKIKVEENSFARKQFEYFFNNRFGFWNNIKYPFRKTIKFFRKKIPGFYSFVVKIFHH